VAISLKSAAEDTDGGWTIFEYTAPPGFPGPPPHWHKRIEEAFFVLECTVRFTVDGETADVEAGGYAPVPAGVVHRFSNKRTSHPASSGSPSRAASRAISTNRAR
jgi:mannose-6-phosphate isomerase-like protein (cupin superfamily)